MNIENAVNEFIKYTDNYDLTNTNIERKQQHSLRVMQLCEQIAKEENFTEEEINLAKMIGLLHDIARFKQYTEYETYNDSRSFDHGDMGVEILENDNFIRTFIEEDKYDKIIKKAIKNHNKFEIEEGLTKQEEKFFKIVRDADKLDIFLEAIELFWINDKEEMENSKISEDIIEKFYEKRTINKKEIKSEDYINKMIVIIALMFDVNYHASFRIAQNQQFVNRIIDRFTFKNKQTQEIMEEIRKFTNNYILEKINEG